MGAWIKYLYLLYVGLFGLVGMMWCLTNLQLKLICRYFIEAPIDSDFGHRYKGVTKTRRRYRRHVKPWRFWSCRFLPTMDGGLAIGFALNKRLHQTFGLAVNLISVLAYRCFEKFVIIGCSLF